MFLQQPCNKLRERERMWDEGDRITRNPSTVVCANQRKIETNKLQNIAKWKDEDDTNKKKTAEIHKR